MMMDELIDLVVVIVDGSDDDDDDVYLQHNY